MVYSDFTALDLIKKFGIKFKADNIFAEIADIIPSGWLIESLKKGKDLGFGSEKSRSERLVTPILLELSDRNEHNFQSQSDFLRQHSFSGFPACGAGQRRNPEKQTIHKNLF